MTPELLSSAQNPKVKRLLALQKDSSLRRECGLFVVEGRREFEHCLASGFLPDSVFICPEIYHGERLPGIAASDGVRFFEVTREVYDRVAYRGGTEGIIAEMKVKNLTLNDLELPENPLIVVLESVEKPGNLGAVLRSADAAGADALLVCDPLTDIYNPNVIRASIGAVFTVPTVACRTADAIPWLQRRGVQILTAQLQDSSLYYDCDMRCGTALVMGTESTGLSDAWRRAATAHIRIPMLGRLDSLNVSVSASILLFEAVRQRQ
jgi:TrmH family RNA methyltransferase